MDDNLLLLRVESKYCRGDSILNEYSTSHTTTLSSALALLASTSTPHCYIISVLRTMPKPALDTVTVQPPPRPKPRPKLPATRTVVTRAGNANKNPMDLELPTSEEEAPPKVPRKRKKKAVKTQEEVDADKQRRDAAIAAVCHLEDNMERQAKIHDGTPRRSSAANSISRRGSYVAPDPAPAPAHTQPKSRPTVVLSTTEDDYEEVRPPAKKPKSAPRAKDDIQEGQPQVKRSKTAAQVAKDKANNDFDAQMVSMMWS